MGFWTAFTRPKSIPAIELRFGSGKFLLRGTFFFNKHIFNTDRRKTSTNVEVLRKDKKMQTQIEGANH